jgi:DNA-directed RNA polymerase omega subunit
MPTRAQKLVIIEKVTDRIPNRYEAVRVMAKEARRLNALVIRGAEAEEDFKPTTAAVDRLIQGRIEYRYVEPDAKPKSLFDDDE